MAMTPEQRKRRSSDASLTRWALEHNPTRAMRPALEGFLAKFEDAVDPERVLPEHLRAQKAESLRRVHMRKLGEKSAEARKARKARKAAAQAQAANQPVDEPADQSDTAA